MLVAGLGLGLAIARCMAGAGARVILAGRRAAVLKAAAADIGPEADFVVCDVTRVADAPKVVGRAAASASTQMVLPTMLPQISSILSRSPGCPWPLTTRSMILL